MTEGSLCSSEKFTAVNVRIINELKVSVPVCPTRCRGIKKDRTTSNLTALKFTTHACQRLCFNTLGIMYGTTKSTSSTCVRGLAAVEESFQLCVCPLSRSKPNSRRKVNNECCCDDCSEMQGEKARDRKNAGVFPLNQVKCLSWPCFVYRQASSRDFFSL